MVERLPAGGLDQAGPVVPAAEGELAAAAEDRVARRDGGHRLGEHVREAHALPREGVHGRRARPAFVDGVRPQGVDDHDQDVRTVGPLRPKALGSRAAVAAAAAEA